MKEDDKIRQKFGTDPGFRVPDGFFEQKFAQISASLPQKEETPRRHFKPTTWQRLKPYVYMAAMFGGLWCTMKMVQIAGRTEVTEQINLDNPPALVAEAMASPEVAVQVAGTSPNTVAEPTLTDDAGEPEAAVKEAAPVKADEQTPNVEPEMIEEYQTAVGASDIDLNQLRAALDADEAEDATYYYF